MDTISGFPGKSYEKIVQEKDSGNRENGVHGARTGPAPTPKISGGTSTSRCPLLFRQLPNAPRSPAPSCTITREPASPRVSEGTKVGPGLSGSEWLSRFAAALS
ncbi:MAG: hypothetical protein ABFC71_08780 [Methanoregula sp.]